MKTKAGGFSLVELMVGMSVTALLMAGVLSFYIQNAKGINSSEQRIRMAEQVKKFTNELIVQGSRSNQFVMFKTATLADFDGPNSAPLANNSDRQSIVTAPSLLHPGGDFVVFVYYEIPKPAAQALHRIIKLEGYYLAGTGGTTAALKKVVINLTATPSTSTVEAILTAAWSTSTSDWVAPAVVSSYFPLVRGLCVPEVVDGAAVTGATTSRLFYMTNARSVLVSGQLFSSNTNTATNRSDTYTSSFNFSITPRT